MKNRGLCLAIIICFTAAGLVLPGNAANEVLTTDIVALIDEQPIESYNINGYTYVVAEDLRGYGYDVLWMESARTLALIRNPEKQFTMPTVELINRKKEDIIPRQHAYDVYETDIITTLDDDIVNAYNVNGQTLIQIDELSRDGYFSYDDATRTVRLNMAKFLADQNYEHSAKEALTLPNEKVEQTKTYSGDISDGKPNGYGRITDHYEYTNGMQSTEEYSYTGEFVNGAFQNVIYYEGYRIPHNGSDSRKRWYQSIESYENGVKNGYSLLVDTVEESPLPYRSEGIYRNGELIYTRQCEANADYRYGYRVVAEGNLDFNGNIIDYVQTETPSIQSVYTTYDGSFVIDENHNLYSFGESVIGTTTVPVKIDENCAAVTGNGYTPSILDTSGNLYYMGDKLQKYHNVDVPTAAVNVTKASDLFFLTGEGKLYRRPVDYPWTMYDQPTLLSEDIKDFSADGALLLYLKTDNSVWYARINQENGSSWTDELDLSEPVKIFDNAKSIDKSDCFLVIDANNTLWGWSSPYYGTAYENSTVLANNEDVYDFKAKKPQKLAEDVIAAKSGGAQIFYQLSDHSLWAMPGFDGTPFLAINQPTKLADDVNSFSSTGGRFMLFSKMDGSLWSMGTDYHYLGTGQKEASTTPVQITAFYQR